MLNTHRRKHKDAGSSWSWRLIARPGSRQIRRASFFIAACWLSFFAAPKARSENDEKVEYPVKLAFLYNFTKFVEWPADSYRDASAPLGICIVGNDPFSDDLERELQTRTVGGHPVEMKTLKASDQLTDCHVVFVPATEEKQAARIV